MWGASPFLISRWGEVGPILRNGAEWEDAPVVSGLRPETQPLGGPEILQKVTVV